MQQVSNTQKAGGRIYYGYIIVALSLVILTLTFGINYTFGVFLGPLVAEFEWTRAATSFAYSLSTLVSGFLGIYAGSLSDRFGSRIIALVGGIFLGIGFLLLSRITTLWQLYLWYSIFVAGGIGGSWPALVSAIARWFTTRRGAMTGIVSAGIGCGMMLIPPVASTLIETFNWRIAYFAIGLTTMALIVIASLFLRREPQSSGNPEPLTGIETSIPEEPEKTSRQIVRSRIFWVVSIIYFCFGYCLMSVMVHIVPHATGMGISPTTASTLLAVVGGTSIAAKIFAGIASDHIGTQRYLLIVFGFLSVNFFWMQMAQSYTLLFVFCILFGIAYGGVMALQSLILAELFGLQTLGLMVGLICCFYTIGGAIGSVVTGHIYDIFQSYTTAFYLCAALAIIAFILTTTLKSRH